MTAEELLARVLGEHENLWGDDYTTCRCGAATSNLGGLRAHVAAAQVAVLREAGLLPEPVETVEWGALRDGPATWIDKQGEVRMMPTEKGARDWANLDGFSLVRRTRRSWPDQVGEWEPVGGEDS